MSALAKRRLARFGHTDVASYQRFAGLEPDGVLGPITDRSILAPRCGCSDVLAIRDRSGQCAWKRSDFPVAYWVDSRLPRAIRESVAPAFALWESVAAVSFRQVRNRTEARWLITPARIDRAGGILADQELPCGQETREAIRMRLDTHETWTLSAGDRGRILALNVIAHEIGHGLGIAHISPAKGRALMNPTYDPRLALPQELDIAEAVERYGTAAKPPAGGRPPALLEFAARLQWSEGTGWTLTDSFVQS